MSTPGMSRIDPTGTSDLAYLRAESAQADVEALLKEEVKVEPEPWLLSPEAPLAMLENTDLSWDGRLKGTGYKRVFDIVVASIGLVFLLPVLAIAYVLARFQDGGPAFFGSPRIGLHGKAFKCWKFRSMVVDADERLAALLASDPDAAREWDETQKLRNDPRITTIGRFLRKSSIDELPQLVNVIRGEMSLVGPRPVTRGELTRYDLNAIHYLLVRPGVTGPWQVSGRSNSTYEKRVQLDKTYALRRTFWSDAVLLVKTVPAVLFGRGAV